MATEITIKCVEGNPLAINVVMTAIEHSMLNGEMVTETVDFYPDTTKPVRAVLDCTTARRQYCPQTSVTDNVVYVSDNGSIAAGVYTLTITCTDTQGKKRRYKSDPCIEVYDVTSAAEIAATFDSETYELNGVFYTFAGGGGTVQADWDETDPSNPSYIQNKPDLSEYATDEELQTVEESIPDVPAWALQPQKPTYTATEVGAVPTTRTVNGKALSQDITLNAEDVCAYQKPSTGIPKSDLANGVQQSLNKADTALQQSDLTPVENDINAIEAKIPSAASASNQLADKNFVNVSIATNTATFKGTYNSLAELQAVTGATNNDYGFVIEYDQQGNEYYDRYKYNGTAWVFEYKIESTPFTAAQWAAIQSGITSGDVQKLAALPTKAQLDALLADKQDTISDLETIRSGAAAGATALQSFTTDVYTKAEVDNKLADGVYIGNTVGTDIKQLKDKNNAGFYPQTHTKAVIDDNGYTAESRLGAMQDEINQAQMAIGAVPSDLTPTENSSNWVTSGGVYNAMQVVQSELTELEVNMGKFFRIALTNSNRLYYLGGTLGNQEWRESTNQYANQCYVVTGGHFYKLVANNTVGTTYAFIKSLPTAVGEVDFADNGKNISYPISAGEEKIFQVPDDCVYVTFLSLNRQPSAFYELIEIPTYKLIENETLVNATEGRTVCTHHIVPAGAILLYDFSITGGSSTSLSCYLAIHKKDGTVTYIGKTSTASGNVEYANQYVLPVDYDYVSIEGITGGSMTVHKIHSTELVCGQIEKGIQAYNGMLFNKTLISSPTRLAHNTVLFTSDTFKMGDCVHIDMTGVNDISGVVTLYDYNDNVISNYGKLTKNFTENNYTFDIEIPYNFAYAKVSATSLSDGEPYPQYLYINAIYKVAYEYGVFKIGNPLIETLESFNSKSENHIVTENAFGANDGLAKKRIPSVIVTNTGASIAVAQSKATAGDNSPSGLIIGRKANGGSWTIDATTFQYNSSIGSLMNPTFVVDRTGLHGTQGRIYLFALAVTVTSSNGGYAYKCTTNEIAELYSYSDDDGVTWSSFATIPKAAWDTSSYTWMCNSPSNGIITSDGTMALACMGRVGGADGVWVSGVMYKPVNGEWQFSQVSPRQGDNESVVFEGIDGYIYLNCRNENFNYIRSLYKLNITDGSLSMINNGFNPKVALQCCITKCTIDSDTCYLMTFPDPTVANQRNRITVWASVDGIRWARALRMTGDAISAGYAMISYYNGKCVMVWENDGLDCRTIGYADLTPSLELLKQSSLICGDTPDDKIHRVACYEKGISM